MKKRRNKKEWHAKDRCAYKVQFSNFNAEYYPRAK